jgi:hypothetical protein
MEYINKLWAEYSLVGLERGSSRLDRWEVLAANRISLVLILLAGLSIVLAGFFGLSVPFFHFAPFAVLAPLILLLNALGFTMLSRVLLGTLPVLWCLLTPVVFPGLELMDLLATALFGVFCLLLAAFVFRVEEEKAMLALSTVLVISLFALLSLRFYGDFAATWGNQQGVLVLAVVTVLVFPVLAMGILLKGAYIQATEKQALNVERTEAELQRIHNTMAAAEDSFFMLEYDGEGRLVERRSGMGRPESGQMNTRQLVGAKFGLLSQWQQPGTGKHPDSGGPEFPGNGSHYSEHTLQKGRNKMLVGAWIVPDVNESGVPAGHTVLVRDLSEVMAQRQQIRSLTRSFREKLEEINQQNQLLNFQQHQIFMKNEELQDKNQRISSFNALLEERVRERTIDLETRNRQLAEYAFINSHVLRGPLSTLMGLLNLVRYSELPPEEIQLFEYMKATADKLDTVVNKINTAVSAHSEISREDLYDRNRLLSGN